LERHSHQGLQWNSENAAPDDAVNVPVAEWLAQMQTPLHLSPDIQFIPNGEQHLMKQPGRANYILFITHSGFYNSVAEKCVQNLKPVHEITLDSTPSSRSATGSRKSSC
jgi:hypothetical protein